VEGCLRIIDSDTPDSLNLGFGQSHTVDEIIDTFEEAAGRPINRIAGAREPQSHDVAHWQADMTTTERVLGWRPTIDLRSGIERLIAR
jgi:nucleoside-diphosphate-sugar epimerase